MGEVFYFLSKVRYDIGKIAAGNKRLERGKMFILIIDKARNLLTIRLKRNFGKEDAIELYAEIKDIVNELKPGFTLVNDIRYLEEMDTATTYYIKKTQDLLNEKGVALIVRIIPDPSKDIGFNIMSLIHYRKDVKIITCETLEEAKKHLYK